MSNKDKKFDAVKMMRDIRNHLHKQYANNPGKREEDLERIRRKFIKRTKKSTGD
jgi:hypothetical protein